MWWFMVVMNDITVSTESSLKKYIVVLSFLLLLSSVVVNGAVTISPSGIILACNGDNLEFTCTITNPGSFGFSLLLWNVTLTPEDVTTPISYSRTISSSSPTDQTEHNITMVNSTTLTFSRTSARDRFPLTSRLLISPVRNHLNGTQVNCGNTMALESPIALINTTDGYPIQDIDGVNFTYQFENNGVSITLEWTHTDSTYSYHVIIVPNLSLNFSTSTRVQIKVPYNTPHNVSIEVTSCGQHNTTIFSEEVFYSSCKSPADWVNDNVVSNFTEPALEGSNVTFSCPSGSIFSGPNASTCNRNGEWEPDPANVICTGMTIMATVSPQFPLVGTIVGSLFGVILLSILIVIVVISLLLREKIRGWTALHRSKPQFESVYTDDELSPPHTYNDNNNSKTAERGLVYADIGQSSFNRLQRPQPSIPALDDTPIEYAKINHKSLSDKQTMSQTVHEDESLCVNLDNLLIQLQPQVGPRWYQFGEAAGIRKNVLDKFADQCSPESCIVEMLDYWLRNSVEQPTWKDIAKILKAINLPQLAHDIESVYFTGKLTIQTDIHWIPPAKDDDFSESKAESPPPIPPKSIVSTKSSDSLSRWSQSVDYHCRQVTPIPMENEPMPALPPKPTVFNIPPRPPK